MPHWLCGLDKGRHAETLQCAQACLFQRRCANSPRSCEPAVPRSPLRERCGLAAGARHQERHMVVISYILLLRGWPCPNTNSLTKCRAQALSPHVRRVSDCALSRDEVVAPGNSKLWVLFSHTPATHLPGVDPRISYRHRRSCQRRPSSCARAVATEVKGSFSPFPGLLKTIYD